MTREDYEAHEARVCIADGYVLGDKSPTAHREAETAKAHRG